MTKNSGTQNWAGDNPVTSAGMPETVFDKCLSSRDGVNYFAECAIKCEGLALAL